MLSLEELRCGPTNVFVNMHSQFGAQIEGSLESAAYVVHFYAFIWTPMSDQDRSFPQNQAHK